LKETYQEKKFKEALGMLGFPDSTEVTFSYQKDLLLVNQHLNAIFGDRADLKRCLDAYFHSSVYLSECHNGKNIEDIKLLKIDDIEQMIHEENQYSALKNDLEKYHQKFLTAALGEEKNSCTYELASILGILPGNDKQPLFSWILQREDITIQEKELLHKKIKENMGPFGIAADTLARLFIPGLLLTFPNIGTVMTQQRGKYYYRGENACYKSSKASIFRKNNNLPPEIKKILTALRFNECGKFFDKFDAVKNWGYSNVNYTALMQHYGLQTQMIDITSDLMTALFFACCRFGKDHKWHPLRKDEIERVNSRGNNLNLVDSRYGILYRTPTEITDLKWAIADENAGIQIITPVGYQPFMRCSNQYSYMMLTDINGKYDMLHDPLFDIYKIRLEEGFCNLIFEQMDCGNKVYPNDDIPDISLQIEQLNKLTIFSEARFQRLMHDLKITNDTMDDIRKSLEKHGVLIQGQLKIIDPERLKQINSQYTAAIAQKKANQSPQMSPLVIIS
jgi:hypothetical protein